MQSWNQQCRFLLALLDQCGSILFRVTMEAKKKKKYTPNTDHLYEAEFAGAVYEPSADSFAFLDALEQDSPTLLDVRPTISLEIGCGSGIVTAFLHKLLQDAGHQCSFLSCDINATATNASLVTYGTNRVPCDVVLSDFASPLLPRLQHAVDVLLFNPPYVPTEENEMHSTGIEAAWAGGVDGMEVVNAFLPMANRLLAPSGLFYLVLIEQNRPKEVIQRAREAFGWDGEIIFRHQCGERLYILRFQRLT